MKNVMLITAMLVVLGVGSAYALPVTFNIDELYDWGREYSYTPGTPGVYSTSNTNINSAGGPDVAIGTGPYTEDVPFAPNGVEDSWGIGSVASVTSNPPGTTVFQRDASQELTLMFRGFDDVFITSPNSLGEVTIGSVGGHVQVWLDSPISVAFDHGAAGGLGRTGISSYTGATEGLLVLDLAPVANANGFTLQSDFDSITNLTGSGKMFLATTGAGAWDSLYDTNTQLFGSDFFISFTVDDNGTSTPPIADWTVQGDARGNANVVPEPMSMLMVMMGTLGVAFTQRKRKKIV